MLIALFALAHLPIFRKPLPLQPSRCGKGKCKGKPTTKHASTTTTTANETAITAAATSTKAKSKSNNNAHLTALTSNSTLQTSGTTSAEAEILIGTRLNMSTNEQEKDVSGTGVIPIAANGNQLDSKKVEIMYVIIPYVHLKCVFHPILYLFHSTFKPYDKQCCYNIKTNHTRVNGCGGSHARGSSKVKLKNVVDYKWEHKYYYPGHLVAVHRDGKHLAYAINGKLSCCKFIKIFKFLHFVLFFNSKQQSHRHGRDGPRLQYQHQSTRPH